MTLAASRRSGSILLVASLVAAIVAGGARPCGACSCIGRTAKQIYQESDAAFVGTVVGERALSNTTTIQVFDVETVYKGDLTSTTEVIMQIGLQGASPCGLLYSQGQYVAIAATEAPAGGLTTTVCSMITPEELEEVAGPGSLPAPDPRGSPAAAPEPSGALLPSWAVIPLGALAGVALIAASTWLSGRRARRKAASEHPGGSEHRGGSLPGASEPSPG
jgi:hypothetical protein